MIADTNSETAMLDVIGTDERQPAIILPPPAVVADVKPRPRLAILGTRGVPACHGGFETFAERLALYLTQCGWDITVYCQAEGKTTAGEDRWNGIRRVMLPARLPGALGTMQFDLRSVRQAVREGGLVLTLGYNTAVFSIWHRLHRQPNVINMDGIEWQRQKWSWPEKAWLYFNERCGALLGSHLIADHPAIRQHLLTRTKSERITVIPYGADPVRSADEYRLKHFGLERSCYALVIARPEPENSLLEIVRAFSQQKRGYKLVVLGDLRPGKNPYHQSVIEAASDEVLFTGAIYDKDVLRALRLFCRIYIHGHTVGGTNPTLVEALGAGSPILAHDNAFNRWVAGPGGAFFSNTETCAEALTELLADEARLDMMSAASRTQYAENFTWEQVLESYRELLEQWLPVEQTEQSAISG